MRTKRLHLGTTRARRYIERQRDSWVRDIRGPLRWVRDVTQIDLVPDQADQLVAVASKTEVDGKFGVSIRSGHGTGKTFGAALAALWKLTCFQNSLVICTAPKEQQVLDELWPEMQVIIDQSTFLRQFVDYRRTRIGLIGESDKWQIIARTAKAGENIAGYHAAHKLVIVDEATGVADDILEPVYGGLTGVDNQVMLLFNPTIVGGEAWRSQTKERNLWRVLHFDARSSPLVPAASIRLLEEKFGADSPVVAVRVDGEFPKQSDKALFTVGWVESANDRPLFDGYDDEPVVIGVDVAYFGDDYSALAARQGPNLIRLERWHGYDTQESAGRVLGVCRELAGRGLAISEVNVDAIGYGAGVHDALARAQDEGEKCIASADVVAVNVAKASDDTESYPLVRDQGWFQLSRRYEQGAIAYVETIDAELLETLESELIPIEFKFLGSGARKVESKDKMRGSIGHSPDLADAIILAYLELGGGACVIA